MKTYHLDDNILKYARADFVRVKQSSNIGEAMHEIRTTQLPGRIVYFYVVDDDNVLQGVLPTRRLLMSKPDVLVRDVMLTNVISVPSTATLADACDLFMLHRLLGLPVTDEENKIVGVVDVEVYTDEMSDLVRKEESDDFFQLIGVRLAEIRKASIPVVVKNRFPWLLCNVAGGLIAAVIAGFFQEILDRVVALALFVPVVLALAESVSIQSLTLTLQAHHGHQPVNIIAELASLFRELPVGLLLGIGCAVLVGIAAWTWKGDAPVAAVLLLSISLSVTTATLLGMLVPVALRMLQTDPRIASGPITLALTDISTLLFYLGLATTML
ncbi:MAG: CBS domain-containing protein [Planctomycetota bacterium]|nr:CBS domain-containing protein [Planctomycetota bacterium]MDA1213890.1 CBS domain-containing protein [Planctomycetota bacterium]